MDIDKIKLTLLDSIGKKVIIDFNYSMPYKHKGKIKTKLRPKTKVRIESVSTYSFTVCHDNLDLEWINYDSIKSIEVL